MNTAKQIVTVTASGKDFGYTVSFLKKRGYTFDPMSKTWSGEGEIEFLLVKGYVAAVSR